MLYPLLISKKGYIDCIKAIGCRSIGRSVMGHTGFVWD